MPDDRAFQSGEKPAEEVEKIPAQLPELSEIEALSAKIQELEAHLAQVKDQLLRKAAEFENYKKRTDTEIASIIRFASEDLIVKLLPVLDDFERSLKSAQQTGGTSSPGNAILKGVELIFNKMKKILETQGVTHLEVVGKPFNPEYHDALMQVHQEGVPAHTVLQEVEKGYLLHDKVIRHARVVVSAEPQPAQGEEPERGEIN
jgi:molecular chaperone GrpE